uniref:Uncharacterized protein n=1 Tax=Ceratitis capitata TaxID=7213 RepID=W8ATU0_CERCA
MLNLSNLLFIVTVFSTCNYVRVVGICRLSIDLPSPLFSSNFGTKAIVFRAHEDELTLDDGETITAYCSTGEIKLESKYYSNYNYESIPYPNDWKAAHLECLDNQISLNGNMYTYVRISCTAEPTPILYESKTSLPKCEGFTTYAIGYQLPPLGDTITAAICYDLNRLKLKYVTYFAYPKNTKVSDALKDNNSAKWVSASLTVKTRGIENYFKFINTDSINKKIVNEFSVENILQDDAIKYKLNGYEHILSTIWWRQLREENWRYFLEALRQRTESGQYAYVVSVGAYGNITLPSALTNCPSSRDEVFTVHTEDMMVEAPAYIWAYVQSQTGTKSEEDFVVIAHNSPYIKDPGHQPLCEFDICDTVDWLKESKFGKLRQLPTLGYTFCCRPREVANVIDNFPLKTKVEVVDNEEGTTIETADDDVQDEDYTFIT